MDNRVLDITSEGDKALDMALQLVWPNAPGGKASHYKIVDVQESTSYYGTPPDRHYSETKIVPDGEGTQTMILFWHDDKGSIPLPYPMDQQESLHFVKGWLKQTKHGSQPDHDGSNGKGWRVFTNSWGHVAGHHYAFAGIQFAWAMYGK